MIDTFISFSWRANDNPSDPSGTASFTVGNRTVSVALGSFSQAAELNGIIERACELSKQKTIERAIYGISSLLNKYRHD